MVTSPSSSVLVAVLALGACGDDDDGDQTQDTGDLSEAWDQLTSAQQQQAFAALRTVGAQAAGQQISAMTDGQADAAEVAAVLQDKC